MKINQFFAICGIAGALFLGVNHVSAQPAGGGGFGGRGNFDPSQFQQRMMDGIRDQLGFTNDADWSAVQPLVQKVLDARRAVGFGGGMRMIFNRNRGGQNDDRRNRMRNGMFGEPSPEFTALQTALDDNAPTDQVKDLLAKYRASQKIKEENLKQAQDNLRQVLTIKQEAEATLLGLID